MSAHDMTKVERRTDREAAPVFILVGPQMGENIGACARVMGNFAIPELRIVAPRDGWPNDKAVAMAADSPVLQSAKSLSGWRTPWLIARSFTLRPARRVT